MKSENITHKCSFCGCVLKHNNFFTTHTQRGYTVQRERISGIKNVHEILGFTCRTCHDEITDYERLTYV